MRSEQGHLAPYHAPESHCLEHRAYGRKNAVGIGGRSHHKTTVAENVGQYETEVGGRSVHHRDIPHAGFCQSLRCGLGHACSIAVHGAVHHGGSVVKRLVAAHAVVQPDYFGGSLPPYGTVGGADGADGDIGQFFERTLNESTVFSHDVAVVTHHLRHVAVGVHVGIGYSAVEGAEASEGIAAEECALFGHIRHHGFGPVYHRGEDKLQGGGAQVEGVAIFHSDGMSLHAVKTADHA